MKIDLSLERATQLVESWQGIITEENWSRNQIQLLSEKIIQLSELCTPYVVEDTNIADETIQDYLLRQVTQELDTWCIHASSTYRKLFPTSSAQYSFEGDSNFKIELHSASLTDLDSIPSIGTELANEVASFIRQESIVDTNSLLEIKGIGEQKLSQIQAASYLGKPAIFFLSPSLARFINNPKVETMLIHLNNANASFFFGDRVKLLNIIDDPTDSIFNRITYYLEFVVSEKRLQNHYASGTTLSKIKEWDSNEKLKEQVNSRLEEVSGKILTNDLYVEEVKKIIEGATSSIYLMVFLGTATKENDDLGVGSLDLIQALESAALDRNIDVRVILDQDDGGEPYKSFFINKPLFDRLRERQINVKFDTKQRLLHSKVLVVDKKYAVVGSHNWTRTAFSKTYELSVSVENERTAKSYNDKFIRLWDSLPIVPIE